MSYELRNRPCSPWSLWGSVVEHRSMESKGLRFISSKGLIIFSFPTLMTRRKHIFLYYTIELPWLKPKCTDYTQLLIWLSSPFFFQFTNLPLIWLKESHVTWRVVTWQLIFPIASNMGNDSLRRRHVTLALWKTTSEKFGDSSECNNGRRYHTSTFYF